MNQALVEMLTRPDMREKLEPLGLSITPPEQRSPEYLAKFVAEEVARWEGPIKSGGLQVD